MNLDLKHYLKKPLFIALEGLDGVGKSTQAKLLCDLLNDEGITTSITAEAKGSPIADVIRSEYLSGKRSVANMVNALAFSADRYDRFTEEENGVITRLKRGESVIADRWVLSSLVYSASDIPIDDDDQIHDRMNMMMDINSRLVSEVMKYAQTVIIFITYDPKYADKFLVRINNRGGQEIYETADKQMALHELYDRAVLKYGGMCYEISVTPDMAINELHQQITDLIVNRIIIGNHYTSLNEMQWKGNI